SAAADPGPVGVLRVGPWRPSWTPRRHAAAVEKVRQAIGRGDVYQANVVGHAQADYDGDLDAVLTAVSGLAGAPFGGALAGDGWAVASASPECLAVVADGTVTTKPIKGTGPATEAGARELRESVKERAEHVMIVDLERNDLAHVARPGTVAVPELFALREWCGLWQAESTVTARLRHGVGLAEVLRAICPPGSVTGTPKLAALDHIAALEPVGRGPAMGALGYVTAERATLGLTIRTVAADESRLHLWAGGGITWRSRPEAEVAEAAAKADPVKAALAV
ncbi:MAG: chorismate-binding protein, partial [Stackebrandtia sp.]